MDDLDWGAIHKCVQCGKQQPEPRCVEYKGRMYCGITCRIKQERKDNETADSNVVPYYPVICREH